MGPEKPKVANPKELEALLSLFDKLDTNQDGVICISDLKEAVKSRQIPEELHSEIAKVIIVVSENVIYRLVFFQWCMIWESY